MERAVWTANALLTVAAEQAVYGKPSLLNGIFAFLRPESPKA
jgi:hypothetical protein